MYDINLQWRSFNVCVPEIKSAIAALITSTSIIGTSCNSSLQVHCEVKPTEAELTAVQSYWDGLTEISTECVNYKSAAQLQTEAEASKLSLLNSARAKLIALGLSDVEVKALIGE